MWYLVENGNLIIPESIDTSSSKVYNYIRKNVKLVEQTEDIAAHYQWEEMKIPKNMWGLYEEMQNESQNLTTIINTLLGVDIDA